MKYSTRDLLGWLTVYACLFAVLGRLELRAIQWLAAIVIVSVFVVMAARWKRSPGPLAQPFARYGLIIAYYATAIATAVAVCFALFMLLPEKRLPKWVVTSAAQSGARWRTLSGTFFSVRSRAVVRWLRGVTQNRPNGWPSPTCRE
jgi:hypothetical protein